MTKYKQRRLHQIAVEASALTMEAVTMLTYGQIGLPALAKMQGHIGMIQRQLAAVRKSA
jgi:hypothetical protein